MAMQALFLAGWIDGEHPIDPAGTDHVAGQPAKLTSTGWQLALTPEDVLGVFKNDMVDEIRGGPQAADAPAAGYSNGSVVMGINKVKFSPGYLQNGTLQTPHLYAGASAPWAVGQQLFITAAGRWDNAPATPGDAPFGIVTKAPTSATDTLEAVTASLSGTAGEASFAGFLSADTAGREVMEDDYFDAPTVLAKFEDASIPVEKLGDAAFAALLASGLGAGAVYDHLADVGTATLVAGAVGDRAVLVITKITEAIAAVTNKPRFQVGQTGTLGKFITVGLTGVNSADGTLNAVYISAGILTSATALTVAVLDGTGGGATGKLAVTVLLLPTA